MEKKRVFFKNLDAWRCIAFLAVYFFHSFTTTQGSVLEHPVYIQLKKIVGPGHLGVELFFVLSGFLITYLLLTEEHSFKKYNIPKFWGRRVLRIWPLYIMVIVYAFVFYEPLIELITSKNSVENAKLGYYLFFVPNFQMVIEKVHPLNNCLTVLWSVGVEEQFYLFWPLLFFIKKIRVPIIGLIIIGSIVFRYFNIEESMTIKFHTFSVMGVLGIGCLLALLSFKYNLKQSSIKINKLLNASIYVGCIFLMFNYHTYYTSALATSLFTTFVGLFFAYLIFEQVFVKNPLLNLGKIKILSSWGKYTYGLYCLHPIGILVTFNLTKILNQEGTLWWIIIGETIIGLIVSMILAWFSYHLVEKHFLKLKSKIALITK